MPEIGGFPRAVLYRSERDSTPERDLGDGGSPFDKGVGASLRLRVADESLELL
jgi:hypothetical protein